ncbi:hypothetical protein HKX48_004342, partial [Thoreauomyces humboldtii]
MSSEVERPSGTGPSSSSVSQPTATAGLASSSVNPPSVASPSSFLSPEKQRPEPLSVQTDTAAQRFVPPSHAGTSPPRYSPPNDAVREPDTAAAGRDTGTAQLTNNGGEPDFDWFAPESGPAVEEQVKEYHAHGLFGLDCCYLPGWARFLIYMCGGLALPATPIVISYLVIYKPGDPNLFSIINAGDALTLSTEIERWSLWIASVWFSWLILWYLLDALPYLIVVSLSVLFGGYSEHARGRLEYMVAVKMYLTVMCWAILSVVSFGLLFNQMAVVSYWMTCFHVIVLGMVWSMCLLIHKLVLQVIAVKFHRIAYKDRIALSKHNMKKTLKKSAKNNRTNSEFFIPADSAQSLAGSPRFRASEDAHRASYPTGTSGHRPDVRSNTRFWRALIKKRAETAAESRDDLDMDANNVQDESDSEEDDTPIPPVVASLAATSASADLPRVAEAEDEMGLASGAGSGMATGTATTAGIERSAPLDPSEATSTTLLRRTTRNTAVIRDTIATSPSRSMSRHPSRTSLKPSSPRLGPQTIDRPSGLFQHRPLHHSRASSARPPPRMALRENSGDLLAALSPDSAGVDDEGGGNSMRPIRAPVSGLTDFHGNKYIKELAKMDITSHIQAGKLARKIFTGLGGNDKGVLTLDDFMGCFASATEAAEAFCVLDQDGNGSITRKEVKECVIACYRERRGLFRAMRDLSQALGKLDSFFFCVDGFVSFCIALPIFGISLTAMLPFTSFILALSFVFGTAARTAFESLLFLFVTHPYDAGDRVMIDNQNLLVEEVGVLTTIFKRMDGQLIYAPNTLIATKLIHNLRRSGDQSEAIEIQIDFNTPESRLRELRDRLLEFVKSEPREFVGSCDMHISEIENINKLKVNIIL